LAGSQWKMSTDSEFFYEREAQHYGFTPFQFLDSVGEVVVKAVFAMFDKVVSDIAPEVAFLSHGQLEAGVGQWSALVETRFGRNYELFESYIIKNVLVIPDNFQLPGAPEPVQDFNEASVDAELAQLAARLQKVVFSFDSL
jgi:hypothetical protein